jgi:hypothetical protein
VKKIAALFMLLLLFFLCTGYHFLFHVRLQGIKSEMKAYLRGLKDHPDIVTFHFDFQQAQSLNWEEEREFTYKGERYDVIEKHVEGNSLLISCVPDKKESQLIEQYRTTHRDRDHSGFLIKLMASGFILPALTESSLSVIQVKQLHLSFTAALPFHQGSIETPPPQVC